MESFLPYEEGYNIIKQIMLGSYNSKCWELPISHLDDMNNALKLKTGAFLKSKMIKG